MQTANASASIRVKNAFWFSWKSSLTVVVCGIRVVLGWLRGGYVQHLRAGDGLYKPWSVPGVPDLFL